MTRLEVHASPHRVRLPCHRPKGQFRRGEGRFRFVSPGTIGLLGGQEPPDAPHQLRNVFLPDPGDHTIYGVPWRSVDVTRRDAFRGDRLDGFFRFVGERQRSWYRRVVLDDDPPWTSDEVLRRHRFTNVYRVLDPGTQYAIQAILDRGEPAPDRLFNVMLYRLVGRSATHARVGFQRVESYDVDEFERALAARRDSGVPVFTGAYVVAGYSGFGGSDKVENVARLFGEVRDRFDPFYAEVEGASGPEAVYAAIKSLPGFGNFLAYQVLVDLLYPLPAHGGEPFLPFSANVWTSAGPGAKRGLDRLLADSADCSALEAMRWLHRNQAAGFERLGIDFRWLRDDEGKRIELSLADVQNCCCEFYKYEKVRTGEGRTRRRFRPEGRRSGGELRRLYEGYPISVVGADYAVVVDR